MRTETINKEIYDFDDVKNNEQLKMKVLDRWRVKTVYDNDFHWIDEIHESHAAFKNSLPDCDYELQGLRLRTWIINNYLCSVEKFKTHYACRLNNGELIMNCVGDSSIKKRSNILTEISCPFTGYSYDHDFLNPILNFINSPDNQTWDELTDVDYVLNRLIENERNHQMSDEYILETIEANNYEFDENGEIQ